MNENLTAKRALKCYAFQRGASMTEFVIISPIALLFMLSIFQFGLIYMAKLTLNNATFLAARHGAVNNADKGAIKNSLIKGLIPFYVKAGTGRPDAGDLAVAWSKAYVDTLLFPEPVDLISPSAEAFTQFGLTHNGVKFIPNDNLEYRLSDAGHTRAGASGVRISIRDANVLKIKVTYGYELKVPLIRTVLSRVMCLGVLGGGSVDAWKAHNILPFQIDTSTECIRYYSLGRIPLVSYATVHMQSDPRPDSSAVVVPPASVSGGATGSGASAPSNPAQPATPATDTTTDPSTSTPSTTGDGGNTSAPVTGGETGSDCTSATASSSTSVI
jgi:hypothetical protein